MRFKVAEALVGREKESATLQSLCENVLKQKAASKVCLVHGAAGSGKTSLVMDVAKHLESAGSYYFISGKFDQFKDFSSPYSEIVTALDQLAALAPDRVKECLTTEARILTRLIPSFMNLLDDEEELSVESENGIAILTLACERLIVACQVFLREFCTAEHPVILFIDDLQWSDENSCRILGQIANDKSIHNLLFIGCYRDEGASNFDLGIDSSRPVTYLPIGPLDVRGVDSLIGMIVELAGDNSSHGPLGDLIHRKTLGNPYFVVQFLEMLHSKDLLTYNSLSARWEWDLHDIAAATEVSDNVLDVLRSRIDRVIPQVQRILIIAAFLGFLVDTLLLEFLIQEFGVMDRLRQHTEEVSGQSETLSTTEALKLAEEGGLIEITGTTCRFSHDRIQECVYALIPDGKERNRLHYQIGMHVWHRYQETEPAYVFLAADQLNRGAAFIVHDVDRLFLIGLNYKASLVAKSMIGIETVSMFVERAIEQVVDESYWEGSYDLLLNLYSFAAEVEFNLGNFDSSDEHVNTVLSFAREKHDTIRALVTRALARGVKRDFLLGIKESRKLLRLLGVKMPPSSAFSFLFELFRTKRALKEKQDSDFLQMKNMEAEDMILAMKLLQHGSVFGWNSDTTFAGLCYLRMICLTAEHGWCEVTPYALSGYGFLLAALGQEEEAFRFSQLALRSSKSKHAKPDVNMMIHSFLAHFERPAVRSLKPLLAGYRSGLETGDMMCGSICMSVYAHVYLFSGLPINSFAEDMSQFSKQLRLCRQDLALAFILPALQFALNFSGKTSDPMNVSKESMGQLEAYNDSMFVDSAVEDPSILFVYYLQAFSAYLLDDLDLAKQSLDRIYSRRNHRLEGTQILNILFTLVDGLISFALCRVKPRYKYRKLARASIKALETLNRKRAINCIGILGLLQAENASFCERKAEVVKYKYDSAISQLTRSGFIHFAAISNELAGLRMMRMKDDYWSQYYLKLAARNYAEWGAVVKVQQMRKKHPTIDFGGHDAGSSRMFHGLAQYNSDIDAIEMRQENTRSSFVSLTGGENTRRSFVSLTGRGGLSATASLTRTDDDYTSAQFSTRS